MTVASDTATLLTAIGGLALAVSGAFVAVWRELRRGRRATDAVAHSVRNQAGARLAYQLQAVLVATLTAEPGQPPVLPAGGPAGGSPPPEHTPVEGHQSGNKSDPADDRGEPHRRP